ncbi:hypothetical protein H4R99_007756 [Coemansia sp. RSA 1722]|nr:hypothetical protein IWW45_005574 [Coemansia sp. RSA 485]KAJ2588567.1 hypothetical protein H4R99_007756 [Coemansia sp. RSA 1722]KAJ2597451.1 hypothetical protein GGF39_003041 [Coemansia sp. RSA 1721]
MKKPGWLRLPWKRITLDSDGPMPKWMSYMVVLVLSISYFLAFLDQTILSTLTPRVPNDQEELFQTSWVTASYLASLNAFMLFYGKIAAIFGPLPILIIALLIFLCGSVLTAASTTMVWLILARALSGLGAAGLISVTQIITASVSPLHERGRYMGILGAVFGLSTTIGPLVGGLMADNWTWRISFYINIPLVSLSVIVILLLVRSDGRHAETFAEKLARIDFFGALMLVTGLMLLLLGLNWGGRVYPWVSPVVIICISVGLLLLCVFVFVEGKLVLEPIIDPRILRYRNVALCIFTEVCVGAVFLNTTFNLPVYYSFTQNSSASESGVRMVPLACGVVVSSILSGWLIAMFSVYRLVACAGTVIMTLGAGLLCLFDGHISMGAQAPILIILGSGIGCCIQALLLTAQATVCSEDLAITTALVTFSQMIGGIMGLAFGSIVSESSTKHYLDRVIDMNPKYATDIIKAQNDANEVWSINIPHAIQQSIIAAYAKGLQHSFILITCLAAVAMVLAACLQSVSQHKPPTTTTTEDRSRRRTAHNNHHYRHFEMDSVGSYPRHGFDLHRSDQDEATLAW